MASNFEMKRRYFRTKNPKKPNEVNFKVTFSYLINFVSEFDQSLFGPNISKSILNGVFRVFVNFTS